MKTPEISNIIAAILVLTAVIGFSSALSGNWPAVGIALVFSIIIIGVNITAKKLMAYSLDSNVEHRVWSFQRYGFKPHWKLKKPVPGGIIFPLFLSLITLGTFKFMSILSYETKALKRRAAKRFGTYSFTEMTEWHNALIGASGAVALLLLSLIIYFIPASGLEQLSKFAAYYVFFNMLPLWDFDGTQIYFGSRILYSILATITIIFTAVSLAII